MHSLVACTFSEAKNIPSEAMENLFNGHWGPQIDRTTNYSIHGYWICGYKGTSVPYVTRQDQSWKNLEIILDQKLNKNLAIAQNVKKTSNTITGSVRKKFYEDDWLHLTLCQTFISCSLWLVLMYSVVFSSICFRCVGGPSENLMEGEWTLAHCDPEYLNIFNIL